MDDISLFVKTCRFIGQRVPHWTQGAGGNISFKHKGELLIKASGARLDSVTQENGLSGIAINPFLDEIFAAAKAGGKAELLYNKAIERHASERPGFSRPSMEAGMHALLEKKWVAHFHSVFALLAAHEFEKNPTRMRAWLRANGFEDIVFVGFEIPGLELSNRLSAQPSIEIFVLKNHGVVIQSDQSMLNEAGEPQSALMRWLVFEQIFSREFGYVLPGKNQPAPLRCYFPDTAVFLGRVTALLEKTATEDRFMLATDALADDRDASEIWQATQLLFTMCPDLEEIEPLKAARIAKLPTEEYRKKLYG